ncbi:MAG TPA: hypothetical protein VM533_16760 [Fimbriiglobus sp.]|jgi:hypothetical protein|nr:hypothetical protein [Fimbriiglobus sp.]
MSMLTNPAFGPKVALIYVTTGALIDVWTAVYYFAFGRGKLSDGNPADDSNTWFWVAGFFLTGLVLMILGLVLGPLGRAAREAELPPREATREEAQIKAQAAANPNPVVASQATGLAPPVMAPVPAATVAPGVPAAPQPARPPAPTGYAQ